MSAISSIQNASIQNIGGTPTTGAANSAGGSFLDTLQNAMSGVDQAQNDAQQSVTNMLNGKGEDVHRTMVAVEKADLSFQLMMEVRNKIISAYQEVSKMSF